MNDKKSCNNCSSIPCCGDIAYSCRACIQWQRNPTVWTDIMPTEPGIYFYRKCKCGNWKVGAICITERGIVWASNKKAVKFDGEWQGPITPKG